MRFAYIYHCNRNKLHSNGGKKTLSNKRASTMQNEIVLKMSKKGISSNIVRTHIRNGKTNHLNEICDLLFLSAVDRAYFFALRMINDCWTDGIKTQRAPFGAGKLGCAYSGSAGMYVYYTYVSATLIVCWVYRPICFSHFSLCASHSGIYLLADIPQIVGERRIFFRSSFFVWAGAPKLFAFMAKMCGMAE